MRERVEVEHSSASEPLHHLSARWIRDSGVAFQRPDRPCAATPAVQFRTTIGGSSDVPSAKTARNRLPSGDTSKVSHAASSLVVKSTEGFPTERDGVVRTGTEIN